MQRKKIQRNRSHIQNYNSQIPNNILELMVLLEETEQRKSINMNMADVEKLTVISTLERDISFMKEMFLTYDYKKPQNLVCFYYEIHQ